MLREIVNSQNAQITFMRGFLMEANEDLVAGECANEDDGWDDDVPGWSIGVMAALGGLCLGLLGAIVWKFKAGKGAKCGEGASPQAAAK